MHIGLRVAILTLPVAILGGALVRPVPAAAQATNFRQEWQDIKNAVPYLGEDRAPIDFTERGPLVLPPTYDLPPPQEGASRLGLADADASARHRALSDPRRPVPLTDPGATATGASARTYLIQPPSGMMDPAAVASAAKADGFHDNVKHKKKESSGLASLFKGGHKRKRTADPSAQGQTAAK